MAFDTEPSRYVKTAISDLQGAWQCLREEVVDQFGFPNSDKLLFHIDEAMSWESVRDLERMKSVLLLVGNIAAQSDTPEAIQEMIRSVRDIFRDAILAINEGEPQ